MKLELHLHTSENDLAAHVSAADAVNMYHGAGYDGIVVTDHYFSLFFDTWFATALAGKTHAQRIACWLRGYRAAKEAGERCGMRVFLGAEVRFVGQSNNDYLLYGVEESFFLGAPPLHLLSGPAELKALLPPDAVLVQAHPFRDGMTVCPPDCLDGIEIYNGGTEPFRNRMAALYAEHYKIPIRTSGSDFHAASHLARGGICFDGEIDSERALSLLLRSGKYRRIEDGAERDSERR